MSANRASQKPPLTNTAGLNNSTNQIFMGKTVLDTIYQESPVPNQPIKSNLPSQLPTSFNKTQNANVSVKSQVNNNIANTVKIPQTGNHVSNSPNRLSSVQTAQNVAKTQISPQVGKSKFNKTIIKDGKTIANIDLNDDTQSTPNNSNSGSRVGNNLDLFNNPTVQSFQLGEKGSVVQSQHPNLPTVSQQIKSKPNMASNANQSIHNTQKQSIQPNLQSQKQSVNNANVQSQKLPVHQMQSNIHQQKLAAQSVQPNLPQKLPIQSVQSNLQSQKQSVNNANLQSQKMPIQSNNPSMNSQKQSINNPNQSIHSQNQSMHPQNQRVHPSAQPGSQIRKPNKESQQAQPNSSQANNNPINESKNMGGSKLMRKSSLKTSRNKSPPQVVRTPDGQIKRSEKDNSGNSYYMTTSEENIVSDRDISSHLNEYLSKELEVTKSKRVVPESNKKGNGFRYFGRLTKAGRNQDGKTKIDQDTPLVKLNVGDIPGFNMFGVLDGHGTYGHLVSQFCKDHFIKRMTNYAELCKKNKLTTPEAIYNELKRTKYAFIKNTFSEADTEMTKQNNFDYNFSGTTCNIAFQFNKIIVCASVGDSRGIVIEGQGNSKVHIIPLSTDHKPDLPGEKDRIYLNGGMVDQITDIYGEKVGPPRVWKAGASYPGLAMSRSLGDFQAKECGVINTPQIVEYTINHNTRYMTICSDGVWEFIKNEQVVTLGNEFFKKNDVGGFCTELVKFAIHSWEQFDIIRDDITVVCVYF